MAEKKRPWGNAFALIESEAEAADGKARYLELGPIWETQQGNLRFELELQPVQWRDVLCRRVIVMQRRRETNKR